MRKTNSSEATMAKITEADAPMRPEIATALAAIKARSKDKTPKLFAKEVGVFLASLVADIDLVMEARCVTQAELARRLECSEAHVSKLLRGTKGAANMTAATMARIMAALGEEISITSPVLRKLKGGASLTDPLREWTRITETLMSRQSTGMTDPGNENIHMSSRRPAGSWTSQSSLFEQNAQVPQPEVACVAS